MTNNKIFIFVYAASLSLVAEIIYYYLYYYLARVLVDSLGCVSSLVDWNERETYIRIIYMC